MPAYVLLADPGAGKSWVFDAEAMAHGTKAVRATDLKDMGPGREWQPGQPVFIDGLDEMLVGRDSGSRRDAVGSLLKRLGDMGGPHVRVACREADWSAHLHTERFKKLAPDGALHSLRLVPLTEAESRQILAGLPEYVPDVDSFWVQAQAHRMQAMLENPLLLELLAKAVCGDAWPSSRAEIYERACRRMAEEHNHVHRDAASEQYVSLDRHIDVAGLLSALLLLSGRVALTRVPESEAGQDITLEMLPEALGLDPASVSGVLSSKLLIQDGVERWVPRHRTIAEYLAARSIAKRVKDDGLPVTRVLALMSAYDNGIVESLRGLHAWLASFLPDESAYMFPRDPLGIVLYGDINQFGVLNKTRLFEELRNEATRNPKFRDPFWISPPFAVLGTADMAPTFAKWLRDPQPKSDEHQVWLICLLEAIERGQPMLGIAEGLEAMVRNRAAWPAVRCAALRCLLKQKECSAPATLALLNDVAAGKVEDTQDGGLCALLLETLYPSTVTPAQVLDYWVDSIGQASSGQIRRFFESDLLKLTPVSALADLLDAVKARTTLFDLNNPPARDSVLANRWLAKVLPLAGASVSSARLHDWLRLGLDDLYVNRGYGSDREVVGTWLTEHPETQRPVLAHACSEWARHPEGERIPLVTVVDGLLYGAKRAPGLSGWLAAQAEATSDEPLAREIVTAAARTALDRQEVWGCECDAVNQWVAQQSRWLQAAEWVKEAWWCSLEDWRRKAWAQDKARCEAAADERGGWSDKFDRYRDDFLRRSASVGVLQDVAQAYMGRFSNVHGETPLERVRDLLQASAETASAAIRNLPTLLRMLELPEWTDVLQLQIEGRSHGMQSICLLAAELSSQEDPDAPSCWSDAKARTLTAFHLKEHAGSVTPWCQQLAKRRPELVAEVLGRYARMHWQPVRSGWTNGLLRLARESDQAALARLLLPDLLRTAPCGDDESLMILLRIDLLPAARQHLSVEELGSIVSNRLADDHLAARLRIAWLVAGLACDATTYGPMLRDFLWDDEHRLLWFAEAWNEARPTPDQAGHLFTVLARVVERLGSRVLPDWWSAKNDDDLASHRRNMVHACVAYLTYSPTAAAADALGRLKRQPSLCEWRLELAQAHAEHAKRMREAMFVRASPQSVAKTLANRAPSNPAELAALLIDVLCIEAVHLRFDDTDALDLFWQGPTDARRPKLENDCRNVLLGRLRPRLVPLKVQLDPEPQTAQKRRADLRAWTSVDGTRTRITVPFEFKLDKERNVWSAWKHQLAHYASDPSAGRIGVYVVLWFGYKTQPLNGARPGSAREMAEMLTRVIESDRESWPGLRGLVIDLSLPPRARPRRRARPERAASKRAMP